MNKMDNELAYYEACLEHYRARVEELKGHIRDRNTRTKKNGPPLDSEEKRIKLEREYSFFESLAPGQVKISNPFTSDLEALRFLSLRLHTEHVDEMTEVFAFEAKKVQCVHRSPGGRLEVKALVYDDHEGIESLTLQRWNNHGNSPLKETITLRGADLIRFMTFIVSAFYTKFSEGSSGRIMLDRLRENVEALAKEEAESRRSRREALRLQMEEGEW
ncbi:MAG: hypothetical protein ABJG15_09170 [Hyphomonadaceae bacterium]